MLSVDKHCEILSNGIREKSLAMYAGFNLFVQMYAGLLGGAVVLRLQYQDKIPRDLTWLSDALVTLVAFTAVIVLLDHYRSWYDFRQRLSEIAGEIDGHRVIPPPSNRRSIYAVATMLIVMAACVAGFVVFNPLRASGVD
jgi:hypothetical protein